MRFRNVALFFVLFVLLFLVFAELAAKASRPPSDRVPPLATTSASGEEMYATYCAVCHGRDGRGGRATASKFGSAASDLTKLASKNQGRFPYAVVKDAIRGDYHRAVYRNGEMPPWEFLFRYVGSGSKLEVDIRINRLTEYIRTLQEK